MGIYRDNVSAIIIGDNLLPIIVISQNSFVYRLPISFSQYILLSPINDRDKRFFMHTVFKASELALWEKYSVSIKSCCNFKKSLFVLFNATAEFVNCPLFLKNPKKQFCYLTCKKTSSNTLKFTATFIGKFIDYRYRFKKLRFINYRYRPGLF